MDVEPGAASAGDDGGGEGDRDPDPPLAPGEPIGDYRVVRWLGAGATGSVYEGRGAESGERVAIKVLHRRCSVDPRALARFRGEAQAVQRVGHPNIVRTLALGELPDGRRYHVMELVEGGTLSQLLEGRGPLGADEALAILRGVAGALEAAHGEGIAHRDLKPDNVLVERREGGAVVPRLVDFGLAKIVSPESKGATLTETGAILGTPHYMAPEQSRGSGVDHRADVYSFGILAYRLLTGRLPFTGEDPLEVLLQHRREAPRPPSRACRALPASVDAPILAMLAKRPDDRPATVAAAFGALEAALRARPRRHGAWRLTRIAVAGALVAGTALALALALRLGARDPRAATPSDARPGVAARANPIGARDRREVEAATRGAARAPVSTSLPRAAAPRAGAPAAAPPDGARVPHPEPAPRRARGTTPGPEDPERAFP